jgi:uncharacterized protein YbjT (DUF2867 family)
MTSPLSGGRRANRANRLEGRTDNAKAEWHRTGRILASEKTANVTCKKQGSMQISHLHITSVSILTSPHSPVPMKPNTLPAVQVGTAGQAPVPMDNRHGRYRGESEDSGNHTHTTKMNAQMILVTGAAGGTQGQTGRHITELLLSRGTPVRAFLNYHSVERAVQGVSSVYFAYPVQAGLLEATTIMADTARKAGITRLVDMVMLISSPDAPTPRMRENYLSEQIFEWAGIGAAHVRATVFYENVRALTASTLAKDGSILLPWGTEGTVIPLVSAEDVARVAAGVLTSPSVAPGSSYPVIGDVLALREIVAIFSRVLGRDVHYQEIPDQAWHDGALARGFNQHAVEHLSRLWQSIRSSPRRFEVTDTIEKVGRRKPKTFEEFVREQPPTKRMGIPV